MASLCRKRITNGGESNYHIFINSVKGISKILQCSGLAADDVRIVCSQSKNSQSRNLSYLPKNFSISNTYDEVKPINFYTSTCFEGKSSGSALIEEGLIVYYYPYNLGSGGDGEFEAIIPYKELEGILYGRG